MAIESALFLGFVAGLAIAWGMVGIIAPLTSPVEQIIRRRAK